MAITIRFTGETSKMSWVALPVEPAYMGNAVGEDNTDVIYKEVKRS